MTNMDKVNRYIRIINFLQDQGKLGEVDHELQEQMKNLRKEMSSEELIEMENRMRSIDNKC